jgi:hypothetical protein
MEQRGTPHAAGSTKDDCIVALHEQSDRTLPAAELLDKV